MKCSGCGKDIPFNGVVCPYCQRDKSGDQTAHGCATIAMIVGCTLGYVMGGFIWAIVVGSIFAFGAMAMTLPKARRKGRRPPKVNVENLPKTPPKPIAEKKIETPSLEDRLKRLDDLLSNGTINQQEYDTQRKSIISTL